MPAAIVLVVDETVKGVDAMNENADQRANRRPDRKAFPQRDRCPIEPQRSVALHAVAAVALWSNLGAEDAVAKEGYRIPSIGRYRRYRLMR
jgi:hypothetical protein